MFLTFNTISLVIRLKELLRTRLIECGWRDELKAYCKGMYQSIIPFEDIEYKKVLPSLGKQIYRVN